MTSQDTDAATAARISQSEARVAQLYFEVTALIARVDAIAPR